LGDGDSGNGNDYQNFPLMTSAVPEGGGTRVIGTLNSTASTTFDMDFYANPSCRARPRALLQAEQYIGSIQVTTDASGNASFNALLPTPIDAGSPVTATATAPNGDTSELWQEIVFQANRGVGGPGDNSSQSLTGQMFEDGATLTIGGTPVAATVQSPTRIDFVGPALSPGGVYDVTVTNPGGLAGTLHNGYVSRFSDVAFNDLFDLLISKLVAGGITAGCGGGNYCENASVTRQQMAVFVLKSKHGICFTPPPCQGTFADVPCSSTFAPWVEQFAAEGITGGCGGGNYCPTAAVRRDQMAVFLLEGKYGSTFTPPPCTGAFPDVACPSTFADWIEQLAAEGVTGGCGGGNYCPAEQRHAGPDGGVPGQGVHPSIADANSRRRHMRPPALALAACVAAAVSATRTRSRRRPTRGAGRCARRSSTRMPTPVPTRSRSTSRERAAHDRADSALPDITEALTIDGYTQAGATANTNPTNQGLNTVLQIVLDGNARVAPGRA
jgi:hypothetical protein